MQWDREKTFDLFVYQTRKEILAIPLSMTASQDKLIWKENSAKLFTVKSAYQVALKLKEKKLAEHSRAVTDRALWKKKSGLLRLLLSSPIVLQLCTCAVKLEGAIGFLEEY
uniref:Uncharacterized protein n=1 Tax=Quercus lobata TaxID=97700 RepID=A0A7N2N7R0_QUELO